MRSMFRNILVPSVILLLGSHASAATFQVNSTNDLPDNLPGDGQCDALPAQPPHQALCSLRAAIMEANASIDTDLITLEQKTYALTIPGKDEELAAAGDLDITNPVQIDGYNAIIDGGALDRVFDVKPGAQFTTFAHLTITNGDATADQLNGGGGIKTDTNVILEDVRIKANKYFGLVQTTCPSEIITLITESEISDNTVGGVYSKNCDMTVYKSSLIRNTGRAISFNGQALLQMASSTISGNTEIQAAAIVLTTFSSASIINTSIINNDGRGILGAGTSLSIENSAFASNSGNCLFNMNEGAAWLQGNLSDDNSCSPGSNGNVVVASGFFSPLGYYGGPTATHRPLTVSLAIDANTLPAACADNSTDQRGASRPVSFKSQLPACDIGAVELENETIFFDSLEWY